MIKKIIKFIKNPKNFFQSILRKKWLLYYWFSKNGYAPMPATIFISVNSVCNARCKMCDVGQGVEGSSFYQNLVCKDRPELSLDILKKIIDEVKIFKPKISITSTEPLLYKDIIEFSKYVITNGLILQITTNGILLEKFAKDFVKLGVHELWVSIDGPPEIHNEIRGVPQAFEKAISGIKIIDHEKKKLNKKFPKIYINYTISNFNYHCLVDFMESIKDLPVNGIYFSHLNFVTNTMAQLHNELFGEIGKATPTSLSKVDLLKIKPEILSEQIEQVKQRYKLNIVFSPSIFSVKEIRDYYQNPQKVIRKKQCTVVWESAQIIANGDVIPSTRCFMVKLGNIYQNNLKDIWNSQKMREFRRLLKKHKHFPACTRCCALMD